jgi:hypothetical protein
LLDPVDPVKSRARRSCMLRAKSCQGPPAARFEPTSQCLGQLAEPIELPARDTRLKELAIRSGHLFEL